MNREKIAAILGQPIHDIAPLSGGCIGQVYRLTLADKQHVVAKVASKPQSSLNLEGKMLRYLAQHSQLPVPAVLHSEDQLLLLQFLPGDSRFGQAAQEDAAERLAALHSITSPQFGLAWDTLIGGLTQPNQPTTSWLDFFREQRLLAMGQQGVDAGRLPLPLFRRLATFCNQLHQWLPENDAPPSLLHGDVWTTNVLAENGRITAFLDPAIYYGHPEIELAFITLFGTFGEPFFARYHDLRPIAPGFFEERRHIYNLYPLLVHVRLFGGSYARSVEQTLRRFGF